ncbi:hypothetical protein CLF_112324 [Clonorchis sinensis]|uniref:Uncharacterized protein n=1 Tax=Clonorchis sinensis TaxID=79923 RepID=G7YW72_CLOSI|nr:hypothetical protein CLF_112324 [Clonorchis sinensis]
MGLYRPKPELSAQVIRHFLAIGVAHMNHDTESEESSQISIALVLCLLVLHAFSFPYVAVWEFRPAAVNKPLSNYGTSVDEAAVYNDAPDSLYPGYISITCQRKSLSRQLGRRRRHSTRCRSAVDYGETKSQTWWNVWRFDRQTNATVY